MCDYNQLTRTTVLALPVPMNRLPGHLGPVAYGKLREVVARGRARPGRDLITGTPVPHGDLARGHYLVPGNFDKMLVRMNAQPHRCQWCGGKLPGDLIRQHKLPHDHREHIVHHFHPQCWQARLLAVAVVFGHVQPNQLCPPRTARQGWAAKHLTFKKTVTMTVKRVLTEKWKRKWGWKGGRH
jgi:hypothetical protein